MDSDLVRVVKAERKRQGLSIRKAAALGAISDTTWSKWEKGEATLGNALRTCVATAFGWPGDWPENPPAPPGAADDELSQLRATVERAVALLEQIAERTMGPRPDGSRTRE